MLGGLLRGLVGGGAVAVKDAVTAFTGDKVQQEDNRHEELMSRLDQYGAEFVAREQRTWWDSFVDGLNRLPRPTMALGVIALFVWASIDPARFAASAQAWALIPEEMWLVMGAVVTFFFGDRTLKGLKKTAGPGVDQVRAVLATQREILDLSTPSPPDSATPGAAAAPALTSETRVSDKHFASEMADTNRPLSNAVIEEWNRRRRG